MKTTFLSVGLCLLLGAAYGQNSAPAVKKDALPGVVDRVDLAPDQANNDLPVNHAKLVWFVSVRELNRGGNDPVDRFNLARMIDQDIATSAKLTQARVYELVLDLQRTVVIDRITMVTDMPGMPATLRVSDSDLSRNEGKSWDQLGTKNTQVPITSFRFRPQPVRFVHLTVDATKLPSNYAMNIYKVDAFGEEDLRDYVLRDTPPAEVAARETFVASNLNGYPTDLLQYNLANVDAGSRVVYATASEKDPNVSYMIDDDPETQWTADNQQAETVVLVDLGAERNLRRISLMHTAAPGKIMAYAVRDVPRQNAKPVQVAWLEQAVSDVPFLRLAQIPAPLTSGDSEPAITKQWLDSQEPFGVIDSSKTNFSSLDGNAVPCRYVVLRYVSNSPGQGVPLKISDIYVSGNYNPAHFVLLPRQLPVIAAGSAGRVPPPDASEVGIPIAEQINAFEQPVEPPAPTPATP